jgi:hypothetical protein
MEKSSGQNWEARRRHNGGLEAWFRSQGAFSKRKRNSVKESENRELGLNHAVKPSGPRENAE